MQASDGDRAVHPAGEQGWQVAFQQRPPDRGHGPSATRRAEPTRPWRAGWRPRHRILSNATVRSTTAWAWGVRCMSGPEARRRQRHRPDRAAAGAPQQRGNRPSASIPKSTTSSTRRTGPSGIAPSMAKTPSRLRHWWKRFCCAFLRFVFLHPGHGRQERQRQRLRETAGEVGDQRRMACRGHAGDPARRGVGCHRSRIISATAATSSSRK